MMMKTIKTIFALALALCLGRAAYADCAEGFLLKSYQEKFECALAEGSGDLLIFDYKLAKTWNDSETEFANLDQASEDWERMFLVYKLVNQSRGSADQAVQQQIITYEDFTTDLSGGSMFNADSAPGTLNMRGVGVDETSMLEDLFQKEYQVAKSTSSAIDAAEAIDPMLGESEVMKNFFKNIQVTDIKKVSSTFIQNFLREPCVNPDALKRFETRRYIFFRENVKEAAGYSYYLKMQAAGWVDILKGLQEDLGEIKDMDKNEIYRFNFTSRQFLNRMLAVYMQNRAINVQLHSAAAPFAKDSRLLNSTLETESQVFY